MLNQSDQAAQVKITLMDFDLALDGALQPQPAGTSSRSLAKFISVSSPMEFTLAAGKEQSQEVRFAVKVPKDASGPHWSLMMVEELRPSPQGQTVVRVQFGVQIRQTDPTNKTLNARITNTQVILPQGNDPLKVLIEYENTGTTFQRVSGRVEFRNSKGETAAKLEVASFRVLPGGKRKLELPLEQKLPSGDYIALVLLDFGGDFVLGSQARFKIP